MNFGEGFNSVQTFNTWKRWLLSFESHVNLEMLN